MPKIISILGSGQVAKTLAAGFLKHGYAVIMGSGHPDRLQSELSETLSAVQVLSFAEAAKAGQIVVLAVKGLGAEAVFSEVKDDLSGKTVIDVTNPIAEAAPENGVLKFFTSLDESLLERLQKINPQTHIVKAFNSVGAHLMVNPDFGGVQPTMFICGDDQSAKTEVGEILEQFGWEVEDMGGQQAARAIEPLCILYCIPGLLRDQWQQAFKFLKK